MCFPKNEKVLDAVQGRTTVDNAAPVVTGKQKGIENPIDTAKVTKRLKKQRANTGEKKVFTARGRSPLDLKIM
tara:strand:+ start:256 stop:474 length:219 start_codon:yes stop_codon:yes gene_type:complete